MSSLREQAERDRITIKIHNMKRSPSRNTPPTKLKRSRYDDTPDGRSTPDRSRRRSIRSPSPRPRYVSPQHYHDDHVRIIRDAPPERSHVYKVLRISGLHPKSSEEFIKETIYREYKKFGDLSIRLSHDMDERVAFVCFRLSEDAREAMHEKPRIMVYDKIAMVEPVFERLSSEYKYKQRSLTPPEYDRVEYYSSAEKRRPMLPVDHPYERYPMNHSTINSRDYRSPIHHHHQHHQQHHHHQQQQQQQYMSRNASISHGHSIMPPAVPYHYLPRMEQQSQYNHGNNSSSSSNANNSHNTPSKKEKFPNYLHHISPEEDARATRTLFAGNLETNISEDELERIFGKYGFVEDIDIKRPAPGTGNAYAFIRFQNLDMAHRAKLELSGQYIGKFQCKIGYGKATPAARIWVGGLGSWTSVSLLEREFDRFGAIKKIEYIKGDSDAYIAYESIDAAQEAVKKMRGFALGGPETRLRTDFAELPTGNNINKMKSGGTYDEIEFRRHDHNNYDGYPSDVYFPSSTRGSSHSSHNNNNNSSYRNRSLGNAPHNTSYRNKMSMHHDNYEQRMTNDEENKRYKTVPLSEREHQSRKVRQSPSKEMAMIARSRSKSRQRTPEPTAATGKHSNDLNTVRTISEILKKSTTQWTGSLILKSSLFPTKLYLTTGDAKLVDSLMKDEEGTHDLRITQRLRLDQPKLEDVHKRISASASFAIFLGMPGRTTMVHANDIGVQTRPLRNLVSYLKQKEAAGVLPLLNKSTESTGVLYAFPPCDFSAELLRKTYCNISDEAMKEDHLVVVVVSGNIIPDI